MSRIKVKSNLGKKPLIGGTGKIVWIGRPSVAVFYALYGLLSIVVIGVFVGLEWWLGNNTSLGKIIFPTSLIVGVRVIPYPVGLLTGAVVIIAYLAKVIQLALVRARSKYVLREDGLYVDFGILNLQNTFIAPMAFSDARLKLPVSLRIVHRGTIVVDTNDGRHFRLNLIKDSLTVQSLMRRTLGHPIVRVESPSPP